MIPARFTALAEGLASIDANDYLLPNRRPAGCWSAAVLVLLSDAEDPDLVYTERAAGLRKHPGQISFPGGRRDEGDTAPLDTALREANEEIGLESSWVTMLGELPTTRIPVSAFDVQPVVASWSGDQAIEVRSREELSAIHRWRVSELVEPSTRVMARHPGGGRGPAWILGDVFLWGFSAYLTDAILQIAGWARPWNRARLVDIPKRFLRDRQI